ncbi:MAG: hypothetical protein ABIT20_05700 [Gemmatimonadaceae bacterium]
MRALRLPIIAAVAAIILSFAVVALVEGTASLALFARAMRQAHLVEEHFTERDTLLGWINIPNASKPNLFGTGRSLTINRQRVRHAGDLAAVAPAGKRRVICSGDSFTLGYGVDDSKTWCALLATNEPSLETVNMGQAGYGIDQAYLWYVRDGLSMQPQVHLFSIINDDFRRMGVSRFGGFPKPRLAVNGAGKLTTVGVPVPGPGLGPFMVRLLSTVRTLRVFELYQAYSPGGSSGAGTGAPSQAATWDVARAVLHDMAVRDSAVGAKFVVVYLPTIDDFKWKASDKWRESIREAAAKENYEFVDLVEDLRKVAADSVDGLFIPRGQLAFRGAAGHYTDRGNVWVEKLLRERVAALAGSGVTDSTRAARKQ